MIDSLGEPDRTDAIAARVASSAELCGYGPCADQIRDLLVSL